MPKELIVKGSNGRLTVHHWSSPNARYLALLAPCDELVAEALADHHAAVYAPDLAGDDVDVAAADLRRVVRLARAVYPNVPVVAIGTGAGAAVVSRYATLHPTEVDVVAADVAPGELTSFIDAALPALTEGAADWSAAPESQQFFGGWGVSVKRPD